jgi:hypothetical protein
VLCTDGASPAHSMTLNRSVLFIALLSRRSERLRYGRWS